ncbi:hypothetical protein [uncultured Alistipes sp.]|uniref:tetratricopeptide repeat protein n=1 Tax=uncultured Alistipes sp. TaxID=538949 RepID=UPI00262C00E0|nr:hypothetical protein [uncultured Alistipes sp.]
MKRFVKSFMFMSLVVLLTGCNCYKKMAKNVDRLTITATPSVLTLKGNNVVTDIKVDFPAKYFNRKAVLKVTPVLVFEGGEIAGTPKFIQGEKVKDNYTVIPYKTGGTYTQNISIPYDKRAKICTLELRVESKCTKNCGKKRKEFQDFAAIPVAEGVSTVQLLANNAAYLAIMPDNFKRVTTISQNADIMYQINRSNVRPGELTKEQVKMFEDFVREYSDKDRATLGSVYAKGYASPDGPVKFNDELSKKRSETGQAAISKALKDVDAKYDIAAYGEDWEGFKELVAASDIKDKDLILQVLAMNDNPVKRDEEIKNMSSVFEVLAKEILPQLRRTKLVADVDIEGRTDAEILEAANKNIDVLSEEEMLYAATLTEDAALQLKAYQAAAAKYNSVRGYNNAGVVLAKEGKLAQAKTQFDKAAAMSKDAAITNNLGVLALMNGDVATAKKYISALNTTDSKANMGLISLAEGNYSAATKTLSGYNLAVAEVLNGNLAKAKSLLAGENCADADYLKAVIAMREGNSSAAIANLKSAIAKKPALKEQAVKDVEFAKLFGSQEFLAL